MNRLLIANWGLPEKIISDRDFKFLSEFWISIFEKLEINLFMSTAYHLQTDGQSERTNQTLKIVLRFFITKNPEMNWSVTLSLIQANMNNSPNATTGFTPNEIVYGFKVRDRLTALFTTIGGKLMQDKKLKKSLNETRLQVKQEASDAVFFGNAKAKLMYDKRHKPLLLKEGDKAYLRLHKGYKLPGEPNRKLFNQRCDPFLIKRRIGRLAYELELPFK